MSMWQHGEEKEFELVVIGGGLAGLVAALRATELGLRQVLVLEAGKGTAYPCNSRWTMGFFHIAFNDVTSGERHLREVISQATDGSADPRVADCIASNIGRGVKWLAAQGQRFMKAGPLPWMNRVLAPPRVRRTGLHWRNRGGDVLLRRLSERFASAGGLLLTGARAHSLEVTDGRCVGVHARNVDEEIFIRADGIVLADGGFQANAQLVREFISSRPEKLCLRNAGSGMGDGLLMAMKIGAAVTGLHRFYGHIQCLEALTSEELWPYPVLDHLSTAGVVVDKTASRFADEGLGGIYMANAIAVLDEPDSAVVVFDDATWNAIGKQNLLSPNPGAVAAGAKLFSSDTVEGLARALGLPESSLARTVSLHNKCVSNPGEPISPPRSSRFGPPQPIQQPPYHAFRVCSGITYTMGGVVIDECARVLDTAGSVIPGLYAAGGTTGGLEGGGPAAYIGGMSKALVLGLVAAETATASISSFDR